MSNESKIMSREQACKFMDIGRDVFNELRDMGAPMCKIKGRYFIHKDDLEDYIREKAKERLNVKGPSEEGPDD